MTVASYHEVLLVPDLYAGRAGWCMIVVEPSEESTCGAHRRNPPIVAEEWSSGGPPALTSGYAVTSKRVRSVASGGEPIPTRAEAALPDGFRAVAVEIHGRELLAESIALPQFVPLDGDGRVIPRPRDRSLTAAYAETLTVDVPSTAVRDPAHPTPDICQIKAASLPGLREQGGGVITEARSYPGLVGQGFLACTNDSYSLHGWPLFASVLLSASHPGASPSPLPAMRPLRGHPGIYQAPGEQSDARNEMLTRRGKGTWLVVVKGQGLKQRLELLEHLSARVNL
jgi:hypothetical protein